MGGDTTTKALFMYYVCFMFTMAHTHKHTHWFTPIVVPTPPYRRALAPTGTARLILLLPVVRMRWEDANQRVGRMEHT